MSTQAQAEATSFDVRAELETLLERDLLGPWDGPTEELLPGVSPAERYLLGRLVPRPPVGEERAEERAAATEPGAGEPEGPDTDAPDKPGFETDPDLQDREVVTATDDDVPEVDSPAAVRSGTLAASSLGLSFSVPTDVDAVVVMASWGVYEKAGSETHQTPTGKARRVWRRRPAGGTVEIRVDTDGEASFIPDPIQDQVVLRVTVRHRELRRIVDLALVNGQPPALGSPDTARLYQVALAVTAADGAAAVFLGHNDPTLGQGGSWRRDAERLHLELLYRRHREYAHGRQCAVDADVRHGEDRAWRLRTTCFPAADVPMTVAGEAPGVELDMARLGSSELARDELVRSLRPLVTGYRLWLDAQAVRVTEDPEIAFYGDAAERAFDRARDIADRLGRAIDLLGDSGLAREAFRFANQAMALQRVRSEVVRARLADPQASLAALLRRYDVPANRRWRPFQLAFVLLCLPGLTDPTHPDAHRGAEDGQVQLLFFPTGGGKTEAYLGLTAYTFAIRRLQGVVGEGPDARDGSDGVAVLMRYTLRLLTAQQFQRAAALVCAAERLRHERIEAGETRWGTTPFRVGLWVGSGVSPNTFEAAHDQVGDARAQDGGVGGTLQLVACPWCGSRLSASSLTTVTLRRRVLLYCSDPEGGCPFTQRRSPREGLPVLTVDEEIYRLTPALVISTVDKFAQLPWKAGTSTLFGLVDERCSRHGWKTPDTDGFCRSRHPATRGEPATQPESAMRLRPPDLIIQDELHLISDALGSLVGLYETAIDRLCSRHTNGSTVRPAVVASTATVRRARDQVEQVFARDLAVFPPQIIDASETFFSTTAAPDPKTPSRRYRGILAPGERLTAVEIRVVAALLEHTQFLFDRHGTAADPYMTVVDYFTSTRELASMRRLVDDDIADRLRSQQVRTRRRRPIVSELTSRMPSSRIASTLADLERPFDPAVSSTAALEEFRRDPAAARDRMDGRLPPLDVLLATSMLQVGVDVPRLGLMVVTGQPKNTAEYIQASSRVGRTAGRPGLVLTIYQWTRPRDLAHYETFSGYHATFGKRVEGLTTTPFSDRALDRGLSGVLVTALRHAAVHALPNTAADDLALAGSAVEELLDAVHRRAERVTHDSDAAASIRAQLQYRLDQWQRRRSTLAAGRLGYQTAADVTGLLHRPDDGTWQLWSAPMSLREVEADVQLQLDRHDQSVDEAPRWEYTPGAQR